MEQLLEIEYLQAVSSGLRANIDVVANNLHISPDNSLCLRREATNVLKLTRAQDFDKSRAVGLPSNSEFATIIRCPT